jgi:hypothetical protein
MEDQSELIRPILIFFKSIWLTELAFIQGGYTPKNVVSPHPCHRYAVHMLRSVFCVGGGGGMIVAPNKLTGILCAKMLKHKYAMLMLIVEAVVL